MLSPYFVSRTNLNTVHLTLLTLRESLYGRYFYHLYFIAEENETEKWSKLVTQCHTAITGK